MAKDSRRTSAGTRLFQRRRENFSCLSCGAEVVGDGYTNHCPSCLWSQHVDVNPGDRASECGALMEPVAVSYEQGEFILTHRCTTCGHEKRNKAAAHDNREQLIILTGVPG